MRVSAAPSLDVAMTTETSVPRHAAIRWPLFAFFTLLYGLSSMGRFNSTDGRDMYNTAVSLLLRHSLAIPPDIGTFVGRDGASYGKYGIGQSLAEMPLALLDHWAHQLGLFASAPHLFGSMTNAWITAAGVVALYQFARNLGYTPRVALATAMAYGLTTLAWVYAKLDFSEPLLTLTLLIAALACHRFKLTGNLRWVAIAGVALGCAVLTKYVALALAPLFLVYLGMIWRVSVQASGRASRARLAFGLIVFSAPVIVGILATLAINWARSGSPWVTGYLAFERPLNQSLPLTLNAAAALLISPRYGLIFFATPVLLGLAGFIAFQRRNRLEAWGIVVLAGAMLLLYATYPTWYAGWAWGPRFLVPIVPFLMLPAAEVFARRNRSRGMARFVGAALGLGLAEQLLGVLVNYRAGYDLLPWTHPPTANVWNPSASPLLNHVILLPLSAVANLSVRIPVMDPMTALASMLLGQLEQFFPFFWFSQFPHPAVALLIGAMSLAAPLTAAGLPLARQLSAQSAAQVELSEQRQQTSP
jgi:Dolichyl-phosphate-mannose-protein mannosyltransferase